MKNWKRAAAITLAAAFAVSSMPIEALAYTNSNGEEVTLKDGQYEGTAPGLKGDVTMRVTVTDGKISAIDTVSQNETPRFWDRAVAVIDSIISAQSTEVDAISRATYSSNAIKQATATALANAVSTETKDDEPKENPSEEQPSEEKPDDEEEKPENPADEEKKPENPDDENKDSKDEPVDEITSLSGEGTKENPYTISKEEELVFFRNSVNSGVSYQGQYISQTADITLTADWTPIGTGKDHAFSGCYDGNNYSINNMTVTSDTAVSDGRSYYAGLFGYATTYSDFKGIKLNNVNINVTGKDGIVYAGAVAGCLYNTVNDGSVYTVVDHCRVNGSINVGTNGKSTMTGGLVGMANQHSALVNNTVNANVTANTNNFMGYLGGIVGMPSVNAMIANNAVIGNVSIDSSAANACAGGIAGQGSTILLYNNYSKGNVSGTKSGGVVGNLLANSWVLSNYYTDDIAVGANNGNVDADTVLQKSADDMSGADFVKLMHSNLSADVKSTAAEKVNASNRINFETFMARASFNDWTISGSDAVPSDSAWTDTPSEEDKPQQSIFAAGNGTREDPYMISNEDQLRAFATSLTAENNYQGKYVALANDIALQNGEWTPIGEGEYAFNGDFNGNGYTVSGIRIGSAENHHMDAGELYYGFFGVMEKAAYVHDLTVDVNIYAEGNGSIVVGGLVAYSEGTIDGCTTNGNVWGRSGVTKPASNHYGGGMVGYVSHGTIVNSVNNANVYSQATAGVAEAGGIVGLNNRSLIANCIGNGAISGSADRVAEGMAALGGIAAVHAGTMTSCIGNADITAHDYSMYVGELAGWATGIGYLYDNFYNTQSKQIIEGKQVNPVESVGWLVGPGTSDEGEKYSGGVNYNPVAFKNAEVNTNDLAEKINALFGAYPANVSNFSSTATLKKWETDAKTILPKGEVTAYTFKEVEITPEEPQEQVAEGVFYGRSSDKSVVVKIFNDENNSLVKEIVNGNADETSNAYKEAIESAKNKMKLDDHTGYGKVNPAIFAAGDGSKENPYLISNADQLAAFNASINEDENYKGLYVALKNDIKLVNPWKLAGGSTPYAFCGNFDGNNHTISNLTIGSKEAPANYRYAGLFPYLKGAVVKNLKFNNAKIYTKTSDDRRYYAGVLSAFSDSSGLEGYVDSVSVSNSYVNVETYSGAAYAAGLIASDQADVISNCQVDATVETYSKAQWNYAGVLTGITARSAIVNNRVSGKVSVSGNLNKAAAGGVAGFMAGLTYNNACDVELTSARYTNDLGQVAGRNTGISYAVKDFYNTEAKVVCGGNTVETKAIGTIVPGTSEGKGQVGEMVGLTSRQFKGNQLLKNLNTANKTEEYKSVLSFLNENWGIDFEALSKIRPWKLIPSGGSAGNAGASTGGASTNNSSSSTATAASRGTTSSVVSGSKAVIGTGAAEITQGDANTTVSAGIVANSGVTGVAPKAKNKKSVTKSSPTINENSTEGDTEVDVDSEEESEDEDATVNDETIPDEQVPAAVEENVVEIEDGSNGMSTAIIVLIICAVAILAGLLVFNLNKKKN